MGQSKVAVQEEDDEEAKKLNEQAIIFVRIGGFTADEFYRVYLNI